MENNIELYEDISNKVNTLMYQKFNIDIIKEGFSQENLFGLKINLAPRDVMSLLIHLERNFKVTFAEENYFDKTFYTFTNIIKSIVEQIKKNNSFKNNVSL